MTGACFLTVFLACLVLSAETRAAVGAETPAKAAAEPPKELLENLDFFEAMDFLNDPKVFDLVSNDPALADHIASGAEDPPAEAPSAKTDKNQPEENPHENP